MKPWQMVMSRLWAYSLGWIPGCSYLLKKVLVGLLIKGKKQKYVAASGYFDMKQFLKQ